MTLEDWQLRLERHFETLSSTRRHCDRPVFALEHGLTPSDCGDVENEIRRSIQLSSPNEDLWLPWVAYAAEIGYRYVGDEYWQTFEAETPGWIQRGQREFIRRCFLEFHRRYIGARPAGRWAQHFTIICWPITHAILPRDLQRQLARILYQLRHSFSADLLSSPAALGEVIAARSWESTARFQNLAQETLLIGQIAAALLLEGDLATADLLLPATLTRIVGDLDRERAAREWLRGARRLAQEHARFRGLSVPRAAYRAQRLSPESARDEAAALGIEPRLVLRPGEMGDSSWDVFLEIPDLSHLLLRFPETREALTDSRCIVAGASGRPLARGRLLHGAQQVALGRWPRDDEILMKFARAPAQLEYLFRTECLLRPGSTRLFRVASDGLAYELRSLCVRPGQRYVIVSTAAPPRLDGLGRSVVLSCAGAFGALLDLPTALSSEDEASLKTIGLSQAKTIQVWPAGLAAVGWDGEGRGEWLAAEKTCIAIRADHALESVVVSLMSAEGQALELGAMVPGDPVFVELPALRVGVHKLRIRAREGAAENQELFGELDLVIREPRPWDPRVSRQGPLIAQVDPAAPTLEQLWEGRVEVELGGPPGRHVTCTVKLFESAGVPPCVAKRLPTLELPVTSDAWRAHFERHFCEVRDVQNAYDRARTCKLEFRAEELGGFELEFEREFTPLRWAVRSDSREVTVTLLDDSGAATSIEAGRFLFDAPDEEAKLDPVLLTRAVAVPPPGGMYVARQADFLAAVIVPPVVRRLGELGCTINISDRVRSPESALRVLRVIGLWSRARLVGNWLSRQRQREALLALVRHLFFILGGERWERSELTVEHGDMSELQRAVSSKRDESGLAASLASQCGTLAALPVEERVKCLDSLASRFLQLPTAGLNRKVHGISIPRPSEENTDRSLWLSEFALRLASDPAGASVWADAAAVPGLKRLTECPALVRAARFLVLAIDLRLRAQTRGTQSLYAGWVWR